MSERWAQAGLHFHKFAKAKLTQEAEYVRRPQRGPVPEAHGWRDATVGHAGSENKWVTPKGSVAFAAHAPDKENANLNIVTQAVCTQTLEPYNSGAHTIVASAGPAKSLQHKISQILLHKGSAVTRSCSSEAAEDFQLGWSNKHYLPSWKEEKNVSSSKCVHQSLGTWPCRRLARHWRINPCRCQRHTEKPWIPLAPLPVNFGWSNRN